MKKINLNAIIICYSFLVAEFIMLKLFGVFPSVSWVWVLATLWIPSGLSLLIAFVGMIVLGIKIMLDKSR